MNLSIFIEFIYESIYLYNSNNDDDDNDNNKRSLFEFNFIRKQKLKTLFSRLLLETRLSFYEAM